MECIEVTPKCPVESSIYGYYPNLPANAFFTAWFAVFFFLNVIFGTYYKAWTYMLALAVGCIVEALGYAGRIMLHSNPFGVAGFQMQICCLILGPAFNSAAIYLTLKHIVLAFGPEYSIIKAKWYTYIFITGDLISLVLQAIGGGMAATAGRDRARQELGTHIMIAGIAWQVVTLFVFGVCAGLYVWKRYKAVKAGHHLSTEASQTLRSLKFKLFVIGVVTAFLAVFTRCVYRIVEMKGGWGNSVMRDQTSYIVLEGAMVAYATMVQTLFHPGFCFPRLTSQRSSSVEEKRQRPWS